jgi:hypothetical protein
MIRRRGLGKPTKAMACVAAKMLAMRPLAVVAARRVFASYHALGRGVDLSLSCLVIAAKYCPDANLSRGISSLRDIVFGSVGLGLYALSVCLRCYPG